MAAAVRELNEADADAIPIAYIVVQKMHHTKFFPTDRDMDRSGNVLPGMPSKHSSIFYRVEVLCQAGTGRNGMHALRHCLHCEVQRALTGKRMPDSTRRFCMASAHINCHTCTPKGTARHLGLLHSCTEQPCLLAQARWWTTW